MQISFRKIFSLQRKLKKKEENNNKKVGTSNVFQ
jgi:hypothetical protein